MTSSWLTPAPPTVAIELASHRVTVAGYSGGAVSQCATEVLPAGALVPAPVGPNVVQPAAVAEALRRALDRAGLVSTRRAALVMPDRVARVSLVTLDEVPARAQDLDGLLRWHGRKAAPYPIEQAQVSHFVASSEAGTTTFGVVLARRDIVTEYERIVESAGIHAGIVDIASLNVINALLGAGQVPEQDALLVHLAPESTTLAILRGDALVFYRQRGTDEEPLRALVHQTAMYHEDRLGGRPFARVWVSGAAGMVATAREEVSRHLGVPVSPLALSRLMPASSDPEASDAVAAPVGALLRKPAA